VSIYKGDRDGDRDGDKGGGRVHRTFIVRVRGSDDEEGVKRARHLLVGHRAPVVSQVEPEGVVVEQEDVLEVDALQAQALGQHRLVQYHMRGHGTA